MTQAQIIAEFQRMLDEKWAYEWGAARRGKVDCAGAFVYAMGKYGLKIYHGSNRIQRTEIVSILPIDQWKPGMVAFKKRSPGSEYYDLPDDYKAGRTYYNGDINDYYHIGLVDDTGGVLNAQSTKTGFVRSNLDKSWCGVGYLKKIDYERKDEEMFSAIVKTSDGNPAKLRQTPGTEKPYIDKINTGTTVDVLEKAVSDGIEWAKIRVGGKIGYMMTKFLTDNKEQSETEDVTVTMKKSTAEELVEILQAAIK